MRTHLPPILGKASVGLAAATLATLIDLPATAGGLVGPFARSNWTLNRYIKDIAEDKYILLDSLNSSQYSCLGFAGDPACVDIINAGDLADPANFTVKGTVPDQIGADNESTIIEWTLAYAGPAPQVARFDFNYLSNDVPNAIQGYFNVGPDPFAFDPSNPSAEIIASSTTLLAQQVFSINPGDNIRFGVYTAANTEGRLGSLTINSFNVTEVPGPLPLFGAGAAFAWSRRLRSRLRQPRR